MKTTLFTITFVSLCLLANTTYAQDLSLSKAEQLAVQQDGQVQAWQMAGDAWQAKAQGALSLPNPVLSAGIQNLPDDSFSMDQEAMTQLRFGYKQMLPRGDSLTIQQRIMQQQSENSPLQIQLRRLQIWRQLRHVWVDWLYWQQNKQVLQQQEALWDQLIQFAQSLYAVGRQNQQDVLAVSMQQQQISQNILQTEQKMAAQKARLLEWLSPDVLQGSLSTEVPNWSNLKDFNSLQTALPNHPMLALLQQKLTIQQSQVELAKTASKPAWGYDLAYGVRFGEQPNGDQRANMISASISVDLPLFDKKRPDSEVKAALIAKDETLYWLQNQQLQLQSLLESQYQQYSGAVQQLDNLQNQLLPLSVQQREATLLAYETDVSSFAQVILAYNQELMLLQQQLRLRAEQAHAQVELLFIQGE